MKLISIFLSLLKGLLIPLPHSWMSLSLIKIIYNNKPCECLKLFFFNKRYLLPPHTHPYVIPYISVWFRFYHLYETFSSSFTLDFVLTPKREHLFKPLLIMQFVLCFKIHKVSLKIQSHFIFLRR